LGPGMPFLDSDTCTGWGFICYDVMTYDIYVDRCIYLGQMAGAQTSILGMWIHTPIAICCGSGNSVAKRLK
jgi:hypothetical protein